MLEYEIIESSDLKMQIITTLQSTSQGKRMYAELCERQIQLRELVHKCVFCHPGGNDIGQKLQGGGGGGRFLEKLNMRFTEH